MPIPIYACWLTLALIWLAGFPFVKRTARIESAEARAGHLAAMTLAFTMLFCPERLWTPLTWPVIPLSAFAAAVGLALTIVGTSFAAWARWHLGGNWSAAITLKSDHTLIRSGPYAVVRHPIYAGLAVAMFGTAIAFGHIAGFFGAIVAFAAFLAKARGEESALLAQFGDAYAQYARGVRIIIPFMF